MNLRKWRRSHLTGIPSLALALVLAFSAAQQVMADGMVSNPYDWVVELETKPLERQFQYEGSSLKKIEKVQVAYYAPNKEDEKVAYEYLWFNNGKAYGMEKQRKFDLPQGEGVCLKVKHKGVSSSSEERKAAANAVLRLALDTFVNKNPIVQVRLPNESYTDIVNEITSRGFQVAPSDGNDFDGGFTADLILNIYSEQDGMKTVLYR
ncbi:MAG: hypothetical protein C0508_03185 [Cyanobacteria bacterium PR.023]|jgi:hypothetical protein|nr:hypothetical protein [Cyanobacteria bacterium PR.023]